MTLQEAAEAYIKQTYKYISIHECAIAIQSYIAGAESQSSGEGMNGWVKCSDRLPGIDRVCRKIGYTDLMDSTDLKSRLGKGDYYTYDWEWLDESSSLPSNPSQPPLQSNGLREVLQELVELKDMKDANEKLSPFEKGFAAAIYEREFLKKEPLAWSAARKLLVESPSIESKGMMEKNSSSADSPLTECMVGRDTECNHPKCPVTDEDCRNGKYCTLPLYDWRQ